LEKDLLDDVLEVGARPDHPEDEARDFAAVPKEELPEGGAVASLAARNHFLRVEHGIKANAAASGVLGQKPVDSGQVH
jgi:hypothetical protein